MSKRDVLQILEGMPEEIDPDELLYQIEFLRKLDAPLNSADDGNLISHAELLRRSDVWRSQVAAPTHTDRVRG